MLFKLAAVNSRRSRRDNTLYFGSMMTCVVAFYVLLSLPNQDVMSFLKEMESDAVERLLARVPMFFGVSLLILFFLAYYAGKVQMESRRHELGVYLMLGMRRGKLLLLLMAEDLRNSLLNLLCGIPVGILLSEIIGLLTSRLIGQGIIGHRLSVSPSAVGLTAAGFLLIKLISFGFLSARAVRSEIGALLTPAPSAARPPLRRCLCLLALAAGAGLMACAYYWGVSGKAWEDLRCMGALLCAGVSGTLLLFYGLRLPLDALARRRGGKKLRVYNYRQLEEMVISSPFRLAFCSLMILAALCLFGAGASLMVVNSQKDGRVCDYTFKAVYGQERPDAESVSAAVKAAGARERFEALYAIKTAYPPEGMELDISALAQKPELQARDAEGESAAETLRGLSENIKLISLGGYNALLTSLGQPPLTLAPGEAALYINGDLFYNIIAVVDAALDARPEARFGGHSLRLLPQLESRRIVADRSVTILMALILPDGEFSSCASEGYSAFVNGMLNARLVARSGLMQAISQTNALLAEAPLEYETYLKNVGRQLFAVIAAAYLALYLALMLLIVANTAIGVQFLTAQRKGSRRVLTLIRLGADYRTLLDSGAKQINLYFGLPLAAALVSSVFGVLTVMEPFIPLISGVTALTRCAIGALALAGLTLIELIYIAAVKRQSARCLLALMNPGREE